MSMQLRRSHSFVRLSSMATPSPLPQLQPTPVTSRLNLCFFTPECDTLQRTAERRGFASSPIWVEESDIHFWIRHKTSLKIGEPPNFVEVKRPTYPVEYYNLDQLVRGPKLAHLVPPSPNRDYHNRNYRHSTGIFGAQRKEEEHQDQHIDFDTGKYIGHTNKIVHAILEQSMAQADFKSRIWIAQRSVLRRNFLLKPFARPVTLRFSRTLRLYNAEQFQDPSVVALAPINPIKRTIYRGAWGDVFSRDIQRGSRNDGDGHNIPYASGVYLSERQLEVLGMKDQLPDSGECGGDEESLVGGSARPPCPPLRCVHLDYSVSSRGVMGFYNIEQLDFGTPQQNTKTTIDDALDTHFHTLPHASSVTEPMMLFSGAAVRDMHAKEAMQKSPFQKYKFWVTKPEVKRNEGLFRVKPGEQPIVSDKVRHKLAREGDKSSHKDSAATASGGGTRFFNINQLKNPELVYEAAGNFTGLSRQQQEKILSS